MGNVPVFDRRRIRPGKWNTTLHPDRIPLDETGTCYKTFGSRGKDAYEKMDWDWRKKWHLGMLLGRMEHGLTIAANRTCEMFKIDWVSHG